jgi:glycerol-3-phosphate dehydrogenase (NAD(P)+)
MVRQIDGLIVIGSGNWGLTLGCLFSKTLPTRVWTIDAATARELNARRKSPGSLHPCPLPDGVVIEEKYAVDFDPTRTLIVLAVPSGQVRAVARELGQHAREPLVLSVSKGFDAQRQCTMSEAIRQEVPGACVIVLTGPTIANEVALGQPTRAVLAGDDLFHLALVKTALRNDLIAFEVSRNPSHHEVCAALKGIVAIATGLADGLELGANVQGVIMTEGLRELATVASFFGIPESVAYGISGAGDLITTCISPASRNRRLGILMAQGRTLQQALNEVRMTVEGVAMSQTIETLWALDVSIPLFRMVNAILQGRTVDIRTELTSLVAKL